MSDSKKYYYLKLKDNYFDQDNIKILESMPNGHIYSLIILKLLLKSIKHNGRLMMTETIPYDPGNISTLASVINHDIAHVKEALNNAMRLDLLVVTSSQELWMADIQNFIGTSSTEADRKRRYRNLLQNNNLPVEITDGTNVRQMSDKHPPELEIELEKDIELKKEKESEKGQMSHIENMNFFDFYNSESESPQTKIIHPDELIQKIIFASKKLNCFPDEKRLLLNIPEVSQVKESLSYYTAEEIRGAFDNYQEIFNNRDEYNLTPYKSIISFLINGVSKFVSSANPHELYKKQSGFKNNDDIQMSRLEVLELKEQAGELKPNEVEELREMRG